MTVDGMDAGWDRTFLDISSMLAEPICGAFGALRFRSVAPLDKFDCYENRTKEIAFRAFSILAAVFTLAALALPLGILSKIARAIGFSLQKNNYTHIRGQAPEKAVDGQVSVMTWNICGIGGGMHYDHGGVVSWRSRLDRIAEKIKTEDPDVVVLQEIYDTALLEGLAAKLGSQYAHFFAHLGANTMGSVGGVLVITKCGVHRFTNTSFENNDWTLNRTFASLEIKEKPTDSSPCARIIGTHLIHDSDSNRVAQVAQIVNSIAKEKLLPTVLTGDLNIEKDPIQEENKAKEKLDAHFIHGYQGNEPTCTNELVRQWDPQIKSTPGEKIDYISLWNQCIGAQLANTRLIKAYSDSYDTKTALSDHNALISTLRWQKPVSA